MDKTKGESKNFCVMPWTNLATETNGKCKICCVVMTNKYIKKSDESDFHIQSDPIEDIWNSFGALLDDAGCRILWMLSMVTRRPLSRPIGHPLP